jgi:hypothetical protein
VEGNVHGHSLGRDEKKDGNIRQDSRCLGQDSKQVLPARLYVN